MYGNEINNGALEILKIVPFVFVVYGFWQLGNR